MKTSANRFLIAVTFVMFMFYGCTKINEGTNSGDLAQVSNVGGLHNYGVLPMTPDQFLNLPVFSKETFPATMNLKAALLSVDNVAWNPPVRDQGQIGSCTAFCGAEVDEILYYNKTGVIPPVLSPAFIYYCERVLILKQKITADNGAYMVNIPQALQKYGDCLESLYLYPSSNTSTAYKTAPTAAALANGLNYRINQTTNPVSYAVIKTGDVAGVKALIAAHIPVMMGFNVYDNTSTYKIFEGLNTTSYIYNPLTTSGTLVTGARLLGGHATPIIGYDDTIGGGSFRVQNSWGTSWGKDGFFYMPYTVFKSTKIVPAGNCYVAYLN